MLGPVALVAVRQQQRQPRRLAPLRAAGDEELVDHDLGAVDEVAELGLPEHERVGRGDRVAVLEPERRVLRERRVVDLEGGVRLREVLDRRVRLARVRVVEDEVAVGERAALGVLAGEADRDAVLEQRGVGERLALAPVDPALTIVSWRRSSCLASFALIVNPSGTASSCSFSARSRSAATAVTTASPVVASRDGLRRDRRRRRALPIAVRSCSCADAQRGGDLGHERLGLVGREHALLDESRGVDGANGRLALDPLDHQRLRVRRVVLLVVAEAAVADEIDHEVVAELGPVGERPAERRTAPPRDRPR